MDLEWSPAELVRDALDVFDEAGVRCTLFATNDLGDFDFGRHEVALHPNVGSMDDLGGPLDALLRFAPGAKGVRWHALFGSQRLYPVYQDRGIRYESNVMMQDVAGIRPFRLTPDLWQLPIFFMDNMHMVMAGDAAPRFEPEALALDGPGVRTFDFHPVHLALNTEDMARYQAAKPAYHDAEAIRRHANPSSDGGTRVLLDRLLDHARRHDVSTRTAWEVVDTARRGADA